jgi:hypothetical protein
MDTEQAGRRRDSDHGEDAIEGRALLADLEQTAIEQPRSWGLRALAWALGLAVVGVAAYTGWQLWLAWQTGYEPYWQHVGLAGPMLVFLALAYVLSSVIERFLLGLRALARRIRSETEPETLPRNGREVLVSAQLCTAPSGRSDWPLLRLAKTFGQTRSGTGGKTHALGHELARIRALAGDLYCCPQARLRTLPVFLGNSGDKRLTIEVRCQTCRVQVPLHRTTATRAVMPAHTQCLLGIGATAVAILRQVGPRGGDFAQGAARTRNGASQ